jgi:hypothetical protein
MCVIEKIIFLIIYGCVCGSFGFLASGLCKSSKKWQEMEEELYNDEFSNEVI